jgi:uncharacterized membrane protein YfcA
VGRAGTVRRLGGAQATPQRPGHFSSRYFVVAIALVLAALMGVTLGMLGGGGSILAVPILRYVVGLEAKQAVALSLAVVGITSAIGAFGYWRGGHVRLPMAASFGAVSMLGAFGGASIAQWLSGQTQLLIFSVIMLAAAAYLWRTPQGPEGSTGNRRLGAKELSLAAAAGLGVGIFTGLVGIGGGFMIVPALVVFLKLPMREAAGTSLCVIALNAAAGMAGYAGHVVYPWPLLGAFTAAAVAGIVVGTRLAHRVPASLLRRVFAVLVLVTALAMLYANLSVLA